jgi:hypothetical protein
MLAAVDLKLVVAVISVIVSLLLFWFKLRSERRALTYRTVVDVPGERWAQFKVVYKDSTLSAPAFIHISILNSGRREIEVKDYEEPLTVLVSPAEVIEVSAAIGETAVSASISSDRHQVTLDKRLLNSQDRLTLHLLVENFDAKVVTVSLRPPRITGVKAVSKWDDGTAEK